MDYSNILYNNQFVTTAHNQNENSTNQDQFTASAGYYYNDTSPNQPLPYQHNNAVAIKQELTPMFQYNDYTNVLQDDNFSIASFNIPDFTAAPSSTNADNNSCTAYYQQADLSPQLSEGCSSIGSNSYSMYYYQADPVFIDSLFPPVINLDSSKKKRKTTTLATTDKRHICPMCGHRSKRKHNLVEHMLTHNPHRPKSFLCSHCTRPFARKYDMKRHEKIHTRSL